MKRSNEPSNIPEKLQYLKRARHRLDKSSGAASGLPSHTSSHDNSQRSNPIADSNCSSGFRIQSEKESFLDLFSYNRPGFPQQEVSNPAGSYDMKRYFSKQIEEEIRKVVKAVEKVEQQRKVQSQPIKKQPKGTPQKQAQLPKNRLQYEQPVRDRAASQVVPTAHSPAAFPTSQPELKQCTVCLRSFNQASLFKHISVCQKVFFKKRKQFSSADQRLS